MKIGFNQYIVVTWGETVMEHCEGKVENLIHFDIGIHHFNVSPSCRLVGGAWQIQGVADHMQSISLTTWPLYNVTPFDFLPLAKAAIKRFSKLDKLNPLATVSRVSIAELRGSKLFSLPWNFGDSTSWLPYLNLCLVIALIVMALAYFHRVHRWKCAVEVTRPPPVVPPILNRRMIPLLPRKVPLNANTPPVKPVRIPLNRSYLEILSDRGSDTVNVGMSPSAGARDIPVDEYITMV